MALNFTARSDDMKKICIVGGDKRLKTVKQTLKKKGYSVDTLGLYENDNGNILSSEVILLPVPTTRDGFTVHAPLTNRKIPLCDIEKEAGDRLILCCAYHPKCRNFIDYGALDSYALLNAVPTAEGAIKLCIENTPFTLWKSKILVIGCGRVGKILAERLKNLGAFVTVSARKQKDFAYLEALGLNYVNTEQLNEQKLDYSIILNTVDAEVLSCKALESCGECFIADLSSKGGFDIEFAKKIGINAIKAPSLPALYSPDTAGEILSQIVLTLI